MLLSSEDGFSLEIKEDGRHPAIYNGLFTTIAFLVGGFTSVACGWLGMKIATYANARTALEARKGMAPAFMAGAPYASACCSDLRTCRPVLVFFLHALMAAIACCQRAYILLEQTTTHCARQGTVPGGSNMYTVLMP